jgi:ubiquinone/menaquinone biosynthesis C-methylase UbiE
MSRAQFSHQMLNCFKTPIKLKHNYATLVKLSQFSNQQHTNEAFAAKWDIYSRNDEKELAFTFQKNWYLELYGFSTEINLKRFLAKKSVIFDAGCGLGYKSAWFAQLAPHALVIGMDFSDSVQAAASTYGDLENLFFIQGDIASTGLLTGCIDYVSCDQVIMHTEHPESTFSELARITNQPNGDLCCYFYAKKALPRELLDDYFRHHCTTMSKEELWAMSEQLTELGKRLSDLNVHLDCPDIPALGIKAGIVDIQRFIYWNFLKCFWNEDLGTQTSIATNFDWYSPSNAHRFSQKEVYEIVDANNMTIAFFHAEEACFSGRFTHSKKGNSKSL